MKRIKRKRKKPLDDPLSLEDQLKLDAIMQQFSATEGPCELCLEATRCVGSFTATEAFSQRIGAPKGKIRTVGFRLCHVCHELPDWKDRIMANVLNSLQVQ